MKSEHAYSQDELLRFGAAAAVEHILALEDGCVGQSTSQDSVSLASGGHSGATFEIVPGLAQTCAMSPLQVFRCSE